MSDQLHRRVFDRPLAVVRGMPRPVLLALVTFALGLGVNTAIFFRAYFELLTPYPHSEQLVVLRPETLGVQGVMTEDFIHWREQTTVFQQLGASTERDLSIRTPDGSINVVASLVTPGFYRMMGDRFSLGYDFPPEDGTPGENRLVILTNSMWKRLGANPAVIGTNLFMDGEPHTIVGVLAPSQRDQAGSVAIPLIIAPGRANQNDLPVNVIGRLEPGASIREAQAELNGILAGIPHSLSNSNRVWHVSVEPLCNAALTNERKLLNWLLLGGVTFLLLLEGASIVHLFRLRSEAAYQSRWSPFGEARWPSDE
jgi:putative ABC transport system permease protein